MTPEFRDPRPACRRDRAPARFRCTPAGVLLAACGAAALAIAATWYLTAGAGSTSEPYRVVGADSGSRPAVVPRPPAAAVRRVFRPVTAHPRAVLSEPTRAGVTEDPGAAGPGGTAARMTRDLIDALRATGETGGIAAFPPPGTNPVRTGLVVPDSYELPEGYVRYYQTTDTGQRLPPILLFSPDYEFLDAEGNPLPLPADGVVPPEMAPPGLPIQMLVIPGSRPAAGGEAAGR